MKTLAFNLLLIILAFSTACKKDKKEEPEPTPTLTPVTPVEKEPDVKEIKGIELFNQALDTATTTGLYNFYNITQGKYGNSLSFPIELAFVHNQPNDKNAKHLLGCATAERVRAKSTHDVPITNNTRTTFYVIDDSNSSLIFDTIQYSESVTTIFDEKATISEVGILNDAIQSDGFGWDKGEILGFKLANGKQGLIKLISAPTGSSDDKGNVFIGKIIFDIKMEK